MLIIITLFIWFLFLIASLPLTNDKCKIDTNQQQQMTINNGKMRDRKPREKNWNGAQRVRGEFNCVLQAIGERRMPESDI